MFKIHVGNISYKTEEKALTKLFAMYGLVDEVIYVTDEQSGRPRGFAFVLMPDETQGRAAIAALNGRPVNGRRLSVSEAGGRRKSKPVEQPDTSVEKAAALRPAFMRRAPRGARAGGRNSQRPMRRDRG